MPYNILPGGLFNLRLHHSIYQEPMRAEGPKERATAVLCVQLSARYVQIRQTAKIRNTTP